MPWGHSEFLCWFLTAYSRLIKRFHEQSQSDTENVSFPAVLRGAQRGPIQRWWREETSLPLQNHLWLQVSVHRVLMRSEGLASVRTVIKLDFVSKKWTIDHLGVEGDFPGSGLEPVFPKPPAGYLITGLKLCCRGLYKISQGASSHPAS